MRKIFLAVHLFTISAVVLSSNFEGNGNKMIPTDIIYKYELYVSFQVRNLENVLDEMHKAAENRREIERQHKEALENLKAKQAEMEISTSLKQEELILQLKQKVESLERDRRAENEKHQTLILEMAAFKRYGGNGGPESLASDLEQPENNLEIDVIMAKLEQDNKFLADLEKQRAERGSGSSSSAGGDAKSNNAPPTSSNSSSGAAEGGGGSSPIHRTSSAITDSGFLSQSSLNGSSTSPTTR